MDLVGPTCIVPSSNVPPTDGLGINTRGVLQERSGNRQVDGPSYPPLDDAGPGYRALDDQVDTKYDLDGAKYEYILQAQHAPSLDEHSPFPASHSMYLSMDEEQRIVQLTHDICNRAMSYKSYSEYRDNQRKRAANGSKGGDVWTDQEELAFWRGKFASKFCIVMYPPCGRKQQYYRARPTKPMGRNELLAAVVADSTGEVRGRKQLSSHLQVVRQKLDGDPWLVAQLIASDKKTRLQTGRSEKASRAPHRREARRSHRANQNTTRRDLVPPSGVHPLHLAVRNPLSIARFDLFISDTRREPHMKRHITCMVDDGHSPLSSQLPDQRIDDFSSGSLPHFAHVQTRWRDGPLQHTQLMFANATLDLDVLQNLELGGTEIGIDYHLRPDQSWDIRNFKQLQCSTTFYEAGQAVDIDADRMLSEDTNRATIVAPFSSQFWVPKIKGISLDLQRAREERKRATQPSLSTQAMANAERLAKKWEFDAAERVAHLTAVQEFFGLLVGEPKRKKKVLTICWTFEQAINGRDGEMMWCNGILPYAVDDLRHHPATNQLLLPQDHLVHPDSTLSIQTHMTLPDLTDGESFSAPQSAGFIDERGLHAAHQMPGFQGLGVLGLPDHVGIASDLRHDIYSPHHLEHNPLDFVGIEDPTELCMDGAPPILASLGTGQLAATANMGFSQHGYSPAVTQPTAHPHHPAQCEQSWMHEQMHNAWAYYPAQQLHLLNDHQVEQAPSQPHKQQSSSQRAAAQQPYIGPYLQPSPFEDLPFYKHNDSFHAPSVTPTAGHTPSVGLGELGLRESALVLPMMNMADEAVDERVQVEADTSTDSSRDRAEGDMQSREAA